MRTDHHLDQVKVTRRDFLRGTALGVGLAGLGRWSWAQAGQPAVPMAVYMDPGCGCCGQWVTIMKAAGFQVSVQETSDIASIKKRYGIGANLESCHTALVGGYLVEGHVPADLIRKMLREKPPFKGLSVPGMVTGSPGMEGITKEPYDVLSFDAAGKTAVYAKR